MGKKSCRGAWGGGGTGISFSRTDPNFLYVSSRERSPYYSARGSIIAMVKKYGFYVSQERSYLFMVNPISRVIENRRN